MKCLCLAIPLLTALTMWGCARRAAVLYTNSGRGFDASTRPALGAPPDPADASPRQAPSPQGVDVTSEDARPVETYYRLSVSGRGRMPILEGFIVLDEEASGGIRQGGFMLYGAGTADSIRRWRRRGYTVLISMDGGVVDSSRVIDSLR